MKLTDIRIYPIKSTAAIPLEVAEVRSRGLAGDRRWVVCDAEGQFLHQRIHPRLALVRTRLDGKGGLQIEAPGQETLCVEEPNGRQRKRITVWRDQVDAADAGPEAAAWFSEFLGLQAHLLFMDRVAVRPVAAPYGRQGDVVSFADGVPLLLASEASLGDLNRRLDEPLPMARFRPNVVVDGSDAWEEESWETVTIGDIRFDVTHACVRCVITTIDQQTAEKRGPEPLKTLAAFRSTDDGVCFGINLVPRGRGQIRVGDPVQV